MAVYLHIMGLEWRKILTYRAEFWVELFVGLSLKCIVVYFLWTTLFHTLAAPFVKGIPFGLMLGYAILTVSMKEMVIGKTVGVLSDEIYQGSLNKYLIYPTSFVFQKLASHLAKSLFYFAQLPIFFLFVEFFFDYSLRWINLLYGFLPIIVGACLYFMMNAILELSAFRWDTVWSLGVALRFVANFLGGASVPLALFPNPYQEILRYTPFYYCAGFPVEILTSFREGMEQSALRGAGLSSLSDGTAFVIGVLWLGFFTAVFHLLYRRCLKTYSGIGI